MRMGKIEKEVGEEEKENDCGDSRKWEWRRF